MVVSRIDDMPTDVRVEAGERGHLHEATHGGKKINTTPGTEHLL